MSIISCKPDLGDYNAMPIPGLDTEFDVPYVIIVDSLLETAASIYAQQQLPARFTPFDDNIFATVRRIQLRRDKKAPLVWRALVHYSSAPLTQQEKDQEIENPLDRPAEIEWESVPYEVPVLWGMQNATREVTAPNGQTINVGYERPTPVLNSAGDFPDQVPTKTEYFWQATVTKNVDGIPDYAVEYAGTINESDFMLANFRVPAECARLTVYRLSKQLREGDHAYYVLTMGFELREPRLPRYSGETVPLPFDLELPDMGLHSRTTTWNRNVLTGAWEPTFGPQLRIMTDDSPSRPVAMAVPLDGDGQKLAAPTPDNVVFLPPWRICRKADFSVLPLT